MSTFVVSALYHFVSIENPTEIKPKLHEFMLSHEIRGTLILAHEGINGTVSGSRESIDALYQWFKNSVEFIGITSKESFHLEQPFYRTKVKIKKEIVTMGVENIDPKEIVGTYVKPEQWNELISDPDVVLVDTRNDYEYQIGSFEGAVNPNTQSFREFPEYVKKELDPTKNKKVAMFCTGGIRCEKSTAYLKQQGFDEVYHLEGGILKYLKEMPANGSMWNGQCFVFDNRVSVGHGLEVGEFEMCHACRMPVSAEDRKREEFEEGVSCHFCIGNISEAHLRRHKERQKQIKLAQDRGESHIGHDATLTIKKRRKQKSVIRDQQRREKTIGGKKL